MNILTTNNSICVINNLTYCEVASYDAESQDGNRFLVPCVNKRNLCIQLGVCVRVCVCL